MNLDAILHTFIAESRELLVEMESALLNIGQTPDDADLINAIFRAAHTIKGSAGLFGLDRIVAFTHVAESVLDRVRNGDLPLNEMLVALLLKSGDHLSALVDALDAGDEVPADLHAVEQELIHQLNAYLVEVPTRMPIGTESAVDRAASDDGECAATECWHLSLRFGPDLLRNGMDPIAVVRYLGTLGTLVRVVALTDRIPSLAEIDPETCYLGFEISLDSRADKTTIESAFDFVVEGSRILLLPPHINISE